MVSPWVRLSHAYSLHAARLPRHCRSGGASLRPALKRACAGGEGDHAEPEPAELEEVAAAQINGVSLRRTSLLLGRYASQDTARELALMGLSGARIANMRSAAF